MADENTTLEADEPEILSSEAERAGLSSMEAAFEAAQVAPNARRAEDVPEEELPARERGADGKFRGKKTDPTTPDKKDDEPKPDADAKRDADPGKKDPPPDPEKKPEGEPEAEDDAADKEAVKGLHPKKAASILAKRNELRAEVKTLRSQLAEKDTAIAEAKKVAPLGDDERQELQRLRDYEFMHDPEKSGRITREFDAKLKTLDDEIYPLLEKAVGMPATKADAQKLFDDAKAKGQTREGERPRLSLEEMKAGGGVGSIAYNAWEGQVINNPSIDGRARQKLAKALNDYFDTSEGRQIALAQAPKDRETFAKQQEATSQDQQKKYIASLSEEASKTQKGLGEWAQEVPVPRDATAEQRAQIEARNKVFKDKYYPAFIANLDAGTPEKHVKVAMGVGSPVALHWQGEAERLGKELESANKRADEAERKYTGVRQAGRISNAKSGVTAKTPTVNFMKMSPEEAWERSQEAGASR